MTDQQRARLAVATLCAIGMPEAEANRLLWEAVDLDPFCGVERMLLCILQWLDKQLAEDPVTCALTEANVLIGRLIERLDLVTDALREAHRREESVHPPRLLPSARLRA